MTGRMGDGGQKGLLSSDSSPSRTKVAYYSLPKVAFRKVIVLLKESHGKDVPFYHSSSALYWRFKTVQ